MADKYDLLIEQGADFELLLLWVHNGLPVDLTDYSARMQIRTEYKSSSTLLSLTDGAGITLGGSEGTIDAAITAAQTSDIPHSGFYDLEVENGSGIVTRLLQGEALLLPEVTR